MASSARVSDPIPGAFAMTGQSRAVAATMSGVHQIRPRGRAPPLTTVRRPVEGMATALTLTLPDRIGDLDAPITSRVFPPKLIPRAST
jgi:hypothetical protein